METNKIMHFYGFNPSKQTRSYLNKLLDQILYSAPYNSALNAVFSKNEDQYRITVQINSSVKRFFAVTTNNRLKRAINTVEEQLRQQIDKWKTIRFDPGTITDLDEFREMGGGLYERNTVA